MTQTELAGVVRKIYKTVSSFCVLASSVKKINGFILLLHCVHVWAFGAVCQSSSGNLSLQSTELFEKIKPF